MPETPRPRGAHSWDRWPPGQGGSGTRDPSLNKQVEVMSQPLHHLEFPELPILGGEKGGERWSGLVWAQFQQASLFLGSAGCTCSSVFAKGARDFGQSPPSPQKRGWGSQRPPVTHQVAGKPLRPWRKAKLPSAVCFLPGQERGLEPAPRFPKPFDFLR